MKNMLNEINSNSLKNEAVKNNLNHDGGFGGNGNVGGGEYSFDHPSFEEIMKFATSTKDEMLLEPKNTVKMVVHFCQCEDCRRIKDEMMKMESELDLALDLVR